ncbi:50S ribosomal protein L29 [Candidatus Roizmanbacteria bacterium RIFCSPLOWO2_01_FULL_37_12]|uniref:Large ribosomal subunit protein uL29 n=1 Tax=Candidatus Roizmanbacteria bacterium RIFCSPLOWO2_01_FULL_37_12 TaxID=1802056 RepID=A0A1F7IBS2_9BACT|nr:MAG: 50S ribosomal protein L29 [Candidatus Roizmanbacteria bacterium RIFCSPHIGHO2_01_FULL_37_16]OGK25972.1 MAG: 50S ribosomal protein L29 [Candidatus Roizmanbacteria bacterium RIFCSPHIGHO2_02_FULL_37_9b]OGK40807.1 MAG: 50S ribosomal protein L29 [Candidatus Roizmanbacteria bacterium RIFCSPLOWO2_01_FULL_37_12]
MKKISLEFKGKTTGDLEKEAQKLREEIAKLKLEIKVNPPKDTNSLFKKRKRLAVVLTLIGERKMTERLKVK